MSELAIGGNNYRIGKLTPFQQFHIARRLAPVLFALGSSAEQAADKLRASIEGQGLDTLSVYGPVADVLSKMSDADSEYVLGTCLAVVHRQQGASWAAVHAQGGGLMFQDIGLAEMMQLAVAVLKENLGNFFGAGSDQPQA